MAFYFIITHDFRNEIFLSRIISKPLDTQTSGFFLKSVVPYRFLKL